MSFQSNVGNRQVYEAGDQRNYKQSEIEQKERYGGKPNSHLPNDSSKLFPSSISRVSLSNRTITDLPLAEF